MKLHRMWRITVPGTMQDADIVMVPNSDRERVRRARANGAKV